MRKKIIIHLIVFAFFTHFVLAEHTSIQDTKAKDEGDKKIPFFMNLFIMYIRRRPWKLLIIKILLNTNNLGGNDQNDTNREFDAIFPEIFFNTMNILGKVKIALYIGTESQSDK